MKLLLTFIALASLALLAQDASAGTIGSYSGCKRLGGSAKAKCMQCVGGGNMYQPKSKSCGMAPGMRKSKAAPVSKPPPKPKKMPTSKFITVPAGSYEIGASADEEYARDNEKFDATITISHPFEMMTTEVTQGQWYFLMGALTPTYDKACGLDCAVGYVGWRQALEYLNALSKKEGLEQCYDLKSELAEWRKGVECTGYRLPTEAEWEYAARAGTTSAQYGELDDIAWHWDNGGDTLHPGGKKAPNAFGLYDMLGSQWEWCWDADDYSPFEGKMTDPIIGGLAQENTSKSRIVRGGSFRETKIYVRAAHRFQYPPDGGDRNYGFRPVRTVTKKTN